MSSGQERDRPQHAIGESPDRPQTELVATLAMMVVILLVIGALYLIQTTTTTTTARVLQEMSDYRDELENDNERLRADIAQLQSLPTMQARAAELGFRPARPGEIEYLVVEDYRYHRPKATLTPVVPVQEQDEEPVYDDSLSGWFERLWDDLRQDFSDWRDNRQ
ncbi:MAG: hypothetical protein GYB65_12640 [Chloroflexi bacterium]|nr:hypothetical protein [Chloroflexota bacterium]